MLLSLSHVRLGDIDTTVHSQVTCLRTIREVRMTLPHTNVATTCHGSHFFLFFSLFLQKPYQLLIFNLKLCNSVLT